MNKRFVLLWLGLFLILLSACSSGNDESSSSVSSAGEKREATLELRLGHVVQGENHPYHLAAKRFAELVNEKSNGEIVIEIFPGGQLGGELELLDMVQNGILDHALISASIFSGSTDVMNGLTIPFLIDSYETFNKAINSEVAQEMLASLEELNIKGLGINNAGMRHVGSNVSPVETPDDFNGLKIRVMESPIMLDIFNALGSSPTPMAYGELYSALQTGIIDAHETNLISFTDENFHEVTEYISLLGIYHTPNISIMNLDTFNDLSEVHQKIIVDSGLEASNWIVGRMEEIDKEALEKLTTELNKNVNEIEDMQPFIDKVASVYEKYGGKHELIKKFIQTVEEIKGE